MGAWSWLAASFAVCCEICFIIPQAAEKGDGFQTISAADVRRQRSAARRKKFFVGGYLFVQVDCYYK